MLDSTRLVRFIRHLTRQIDRLRFFVAHLDAQPAPGGADAQVAIPEATDQIKWLTRWLLQRESRCIFLNGFLHRGTDLRSGAKESIRGHQALKRLVRTVEIVALHEKINPTQTIPKIGEHGSREKLIPERFPKPLYFSERLRVLGPTLDVANAVLPKRLLELGLTSPRGVLASLIREHLGGRSEARDRAFESLEDERCFLMVRDDVSDDESRVIVHERRHVEPLVTSQQKGKYVGLPELIRLGALESTRRRRRPRNIRRAIREQTRLVENSADLRLGDTDPFESLEQIANLPGPVLRVLFPKLRHGVALGTSTRCSALRRFCWARLRSLEALESVGPVAPKPDGERGNADTERAGHILCFGTIFDHCPDCAQPQLERIRSPRTTTPNHQVMLLAT